MTESKRPQRAGDVAAGSWRTRIALLTATHVVGTLPSVSVLAMSPVIRDELALSTAQIGLFMSAYYGAQMLCVFAAGAFSDRVGIGRALVVAHLLLVTGVLLMASARDLHTALAAMAVIGAGYAIVNPATARAVLEWFSYERRATAMGVKQTGVPLGGVLAAGCGILAAQIHWQKIMWLVAAATVVNLLLCLLLTRREAPRTASDSTSPPLLEAFVHQFRDRNIRSFAVVNICLQVGQTNFFTFITVFMRDVALASQPLAASCLGLAQAASALGRVLWGIVCDRYYQGRRTVLVMQIGLIAVVLFVLLTVVRPGPLFWLGLLGTAVLGLTIAAYAGLTLVIAAESAPPNQAGTTIGFNLMAVFIGGVIGPPIFSVAMTTADSYASGWLVTAAIVLIGIALLRRYFVEPSSAPK